MSEAFAISQNALDELFPADPAPAPQAPVTPPVVAESVPVTPQAPPIAPNEPYLKASTGTVYNTREAAEQGIAQKDAVIEQLRQRIALATGIDPLSERPVAAVGPQGNKNYMTDPDSYTDALKGAHNPRELADVQSKFVMDVFQPLAPAITSVSREQAFSKVKAEIPEFSNFYGSTDYKATLDTVPDLKEAIETAEGDIRYHTRLPQLLKVAYLVNQGRKLPELLKQVQPATPNPTPVRPTNVPSTSVPPEPIVTSGTSVFTDSSARKAYIAEFEKNFGNRPL
jgi:hypothetical protein